MKRFSVVIWLIITAVIAGFYGYKIFAADDKSELLIGEATHGHYQIELACNSCHTEAFGGGEVLQNACTGCHQDELDAAHDAHPKKKFNDPRNADRLAVVDARYCVSCHTEHQSEQTHAMGLTLPGDYCYHCHQEIAEERESHQNLEFDSCASAGCHNYHDNRALYESFLVKHAGGVWLKELPELLTANYSAELAPKSHAFSHKHSTVAAQHPEIAEALSHSGHKELSCASCHSDSEGSWFEKPSTEQCATCHSKETQTFKEGKHGMRLAQGLTAMSPSHSSLDFKEGALQTSLDCNSCHQPHQEVADFSATEACLGCHNDDHSLAFENSKHAQLDGELNVSCATCHLPNIETEHFDQTLVMVQHNQNDNLRPNEKMIRPVCMQCHSLAFAIDALADEELVKRNFTGQPQQHIPSIDWAMKREKAE